MQSAKFDRNLPKRSKEVRNVENGKRQTDEVPSELALISLDGRVVSLWSGVYKGAQRAV